MEKEGKTGREGRGTGGKRVECGDGEKKTEGNITEAGQGRACSKAGSVCRFHCDALQLLAAAL